MDDPHMTRDVFCAVRRPVNGEEYEWSKLSAMGDFATEAPMQTRSVVSRPPFTSISAHFSV